MASTAFAAAIIKEAGIFPATLFDQMIQTAAEPPETEVMP